MTISISAIRTTKTLRTKFLEATLRQNIGFFDRKDAGSIATQVTTNGNLVNIGISEKLGLLIQGTATFVAAFAVAFAVQWKLTFIVVCIVPLIIIVTAICIGFDSQYEASILSIYSQAGSMAQEVFQSVKTVQAFWAKPRFARKYEKFLADAKKEGAKKSPVYGVLFSTEFFCVFSGFGLAFWQGVRRYASGEISNAGDVVTYVVPLYLRSNHHWATTLTWTVLFSPLF